MQFLHDLIGNQLMNLNIEPAKNDLNLLDRIIIINQLSMAPIQVSTLAFVLLNQPCTFKKQF